MENFDNRILILGKNSYIGKNIYEYFLSKGYDKENLDIVSLRETKLEEISFKNYDVVINCVGIPHKRNVKNEDFFAINTDLVSRIADKAKSDNVKQFIHISSMLVYSNNEIIIDKNTVEKPKAAYGESKLKADKYLLKISDKNFKVAVVRSPMVYGKNCKGNYQLIRKFAKVSPIFPDIDNKRSMIYIGNLCSSIFDIVLNKKSGLFLPQNSEYVKTSEMVRLIGKYNNRKINLVKVFNFIIKNIKINLFKKVFGNFMYDRIDTVDEYSFEESIRLTET